MKSVKQTEANRIIDCLQRVRLKDMFVTEVSSIFEKISEMESDIKNLKGVIALLERSLYYNSIDMTNRDSIKEYKFTADMYADSTMNLSYMEYTEDGTPYRWTGPSPYIRFILPLDRSEDLLLRLRYIAPPLPDVQLPLICHVDDKCVATVDEPTGFLEVDVPKRSGAQVLRASSITFSVKKATKPDQESERAIGFGLIEMSISAKI